RQRGVAAPAVPREDVRGRAPEGRLRRGRRAARGGEVRQGRLARREDVAGAVSSNETDTPTTPAEHYWVANELRRLGVKWVSLAPRFVGRFEKGVDYIGDLGERETDIAPHTD